MAEIRSRSRFLALHSSQSISALRLNLDQWLKSLIHVLSISTLRSRYLTKIPFQINGLDELLEKTWAQGGAPSKLGFDLDKNVVPSKCGALIQMVGVLTK